MTFAMGGQMIGTHEMGLSCYDQKPIQGVSSRNQDLQSQSAVAVKVIACLRAPACFQTHSKKGKF